MSQPYYFGGHCTFVSLKVPRFLRPMASRFTIYSINQISDLIYQISYIIYKISDILYQISYINKISYMSI